MRSPEEYRRFHLKGAVNRELEEPLNQPEEIDRTLKAVQSEYPDTPYDLEHLLIKFTSFFKQSMNGKERLRTVSYTHLDVYKRQGTY